MWEHQAQSKIHIQSKIQITNSNQEPPASSKAPNEDLKDMDVLCTFKIKVESQNLDHGCIKDQWWVMRGSKSHEPLISPMILSKRRVLKGCRIPYGHNLLLCHLPVEKVTVWPIGTCKFFDQTEI